MTRIVAITPTRDEENFLPVLIACMADQTMRPERWIVIDDGSEDATAEILDRAARRHRWIEAHHLERGHPRKPGGEGIIMQHLPREVWQDCDFIFRVDSDISFGSDFLEKQCSEFARDPKLGISSAILYEPVKGRWVPVNGPEFHTRGPTKLYARACFEAIGGLEPGLGWDTIDEIRAIMAGFTSRSFAHIRAFHHRPQGTARGLWRGKFMAGRAAYYAGYSSLFMLARAARMSLHPPLLLGGPLLMAGYLEGYLRQRPRIASPEVVKFVRRQQIRRLLQMETVWR